MNGKSKIRIIIFIAVALLAGGLSGCKSSKKSVKGSSGFSYTTITTTDKSTDATDNSSDGGSLLVSEAMTWLGTPYRYGGQDYTGTDCSGLTMKVYQKALGIALPRTTVEQQKFCQLVQKNSLNTGDLVFFSTGRDKSRVSHVGIYIGNGKFIHASSSKGVIISNIGELYYVNNYHSSGHVLRPGENKSTENTRQQDMPNVKFSEIKQPIEINEAIESKIDSIYGSFIF